MSAEQFIAAAKIADWQQVRLNGGPPCFHLMPYGRFCLRAEAWFGHDGMDDHAYVPLETLLKQVREAGDGKGNAPQGDRHHTGDAENCPLCDEIKELKKKFE